jgi:hypothetical protein
VKVAQAFESLLFKIGHALASRLFYDICPEQDLLRLWELLILYKSSLIVLYGFNLDLFRKWLSGDRKAWCTS